MKRSDRGEGAERGTLRRPFGHVRGNLQYLPTPSIDQVENRTRMAVQVRRESPFVARLIEALPEIRERFGVERIGIFGSTARGEEQPDSDVDVLVGFAPGQATFRNFMELAFFLEDLFSRRVDLVTEQGLNAYLRPDIEQEVVWIDA
jgi:uncharacterized protein